MQKIQVDCRGRSSDAFVEFERLCREARRAELPDCIRHDHLESLLKHNSPEHLLESILESERAFAEQVALERALPFDELRKMLLSGAIFVRGYTKVGRPIMWLNFAHCKKKWLEEPYLQVYITWMKRIAMLRRREDSVDHKIVVVQDELNRSPLSFSVQGFGAYLAMSKRLFLPGDISARIIIVNPSWAVRATNYLINTIQPTTMDERIVMLSNRQKIVDMVATEEDLPPAFSSTGLPFRPLESIVGDFETHFTRQPMTYSQVFNPPFHSPSSVNFHIDSAERTRSDHSLLLAQYSSSLASRDITRESTGTGAPSGIDGETMD